MKLIAFIFCILLTAVSGAQNFSNKGKEFWVGYGHNQLFGAGNTQSMVLYLSAQQAANVTVSVNGTSWVKTYAIPANTVVPSDLLPKTGPEDCRILSEGLGNRGIHIVSDVPIVAYAHTYGMYSSGGTMLLPVETYSYTYFSVNPEQNAIDSYSWFYIVASEDNTKIRITPSRPTAGGQAQNVPFFVTLNKGQLYNVMGKINGNSSYDMSGSKIQSLPGPDGICHPVGVFSGSSRTYICAGDPFGSGSDYVMQQVFPINAWGNKYITALTSRSTSPSALNNNKFRIYIREPNTLVRKNGVIMSGLTNNFFYDFLATGGDVITATKPILVAQFIPSATGCGTLGLGDPEMFCLSPVEQSINDIAFYNTDKESIEVNYLTLIIPQKGLSSLLIDGSNSFDYTYAHPNAPGYSVVVKQLPVTAMQHTAKSDSGFTAITYGLGQYETYGYNAGTSLRNLESVVQVKNLLGNGLTAYTCPNTPFHAVLKTTYQPSSITWHLGSIRGLSPRADTVLSNYPVPTDSVIEFQRKFYLYELPGNYTFDSIGTYQLPVTITDLLIENCSYSTSLVIPLNVIAGPDADFTLAGLKCTNDSVSLQGISNANPVKWIWNLGDGGIDSLQQIKKRYQLPGSYDVKLQVVRTLDGCLGTREKTVAIDPSPIAAFKLKDSVICMPGGSVVFVNESKATGDSSLSYAWDFNDNLFATVQHPSHHYAVAGNYLVKLIATTSGNGCSDTATKLVNGFVTKPVAAFDPVAAPVCAGTTIQMTDRSVSTNPVLAGKWLLNGDPFATGQNVSKKLVQAGSNLVQLVIADVNGCADTAAKTWQVLALPIVNAGPDKSVTPGNSVQLDATVNDPLAALSWSPAGSLSATTLLRPMAFPSVTQRYTLTVTDQNNCTASDDVVVKLMTELFIPNAFTPNGDGLNDTWNIPGLNAYDNATVEIFNRYGQRVYQSTNYNNPWDGTFKGSKQPAGAYIYIVNTQKPVGGLLKGTVLLLR